MNDPEERAAISAAWDDHYYSERSGTFLAAFEAAWAAGRAYEREQVQLALDDLERRDETGALDRLRTLVGTAAPDEFREFPETGAKK